MAKKPLFPLFVDLDGAPCLLVGGGTVACRKAEKLLPYGAALTVVAPHFVPRLAALPGVTLCRRAFAPQDLQGKALVIAATDDVALNHRISAACRAAGTPVNVVDDAAACSFQFPALVAQGPLSVGVSTGGASPTAAAYLKEQIANSLPPHLDEILLWLERTRPAVKANCPDEGARAAVYRALLGACLAAGRPLNEAEFAQLCAAPAPTAPQQGRVYLVGAGCGGADWITVKGQSLLRRCDAVVYDALVDPALLALVPTGAEKILVGKRAGQPSAAQDEINGILVAQAQKGRVVVRLKGGDPFVFGRGGEEAEALQAAGIPFEVVPGVSSAVAIPGQAGIPVTHRGLSRSFHVITAHTAEDTLPQNMEKLAALDGTLVFLMGTAHLPQLAAALMAAGERGTTPAAVVAGGNAPHPCTVRGTLAEIAAKTAAADLKPPAVIVVGEVAALNFTGDSPPGAAT